MSGYPQFPQAYPQRLRAEHAGLPATRVHGRLPSVDNRGPRGDRHQQPERPLAKNLAALSVVANSPGEPPLDFHRNTLSIFTAIQEGL